MSPGLDRKSTDKVRAFNSRASHRARYTEEREAAQAEEEEFWHDVAAFIETVSGYAPDFSRMKQRDIEAWCARYHAHDKEMSQPVTPRSMPVYGRDYRERHWQRYYA